jgi:DNA-binding CsgD family transcriptional regulator
MLLEREEPLAELSRTMAHAIAGHGSVVAILGEAGIGKTSLVDGFCVSAPAPTRTYWGTCDPLEPPRPFTPIVDVAAQVGGDLRRALAGGNRDAVLESFLGLLRREDAGPALVVLDDLHWADAATLDLLRVIGRRVSRMPALVIGTYRDHEVGYDHPLRLALGEIPTAAMADVRLAPLSVAAVGRLAGVGHERATVLHRATGGNPFFVTEVIASGGDGVPTTVRDAVLTRLSHLSAGAQSTARAASILGPAAEISVVLDVAEVERIALDECVIHAMLELDEGTVSFRHELARRAVLDALPLSDSTALHRRALEVLRAPVPIDWPRLARHAIAAGDRQATLELAPKAAEYAARLGAHREAAAFYESVLEVATNLPDAARAELLERCADESRLVDDMPRALECQSQALEIWRRLPELVRVGTCLTELSLLLWLAGTAEDATTAAREAVAILAMAAPHSADLARAWAILAQRQMVRGDPNDLVMASSANAIELAKRLGDVAVELHARTTLAVALIFSDDETGWTALEETATRAQRSGHAEEAVRARINLMEAARDLRRFQLADRYLAEAAAHLDQYELALYDHILRSRIAGLELDTGRWDAAVDHARFLLDLGRSSNRIRVRALTIIGTVAARRADGTAWSVLEEALALADDDPQEMVPLRLGRAEAAWLAGRDDVAREEAAMGLEIAPRELSRWWRSNLAFWATRAGASGPLPHPDEAPYWLHATGRLAAAADAWESIGAPYERALALADSERETDLREALRIFNTLGAAAMSRRTTERLQRLGAVRIPRGPRSGTRANPAQLTARQLEILGLIADGLGNADIAERLVISPKTVDHHVSAILAKLGVPNRGAAKAVARQLGLRGTAQDGEAAVAR